jgi:hypothetical protein
MSALRRGCGQRCSRSDRNRLNFFGNSPRVVLVLAGAVSCFSTVLNAGPQPTFIDYAEPKFLVGNIYAIGPGPKEWLFRSERRSTQTGTTVHATCDYTYPDGSLAARDRIRYEAGRLVSFEENELQTGEKGVAQIRPDPKSPGKWRIYFEYTIGQGSSAKTTTASEALEKDTLIDDMIPAFIVVHWDDLQRGASAKFRYIVLSRKETVGFKLTKESETTWQGHPVVRIKMEPTSFIIAQLVEPLFFIVERTGQHRILQYIGRTTPMVKNGNKWKELDAISTFDWKQDVARNSAGENPPDHR